MSIGFIFWLLMILWLVFGVVVYSKRPATPGTPWLWSSGGDAFTFVLFALLGVQAFGWPIK